MGDFYKYPISDIGVVCHYFTTDHTIPKSLNKGPYRAIYAKLQGAEEVFRKTL